MLIGNPPYVRQEMLGEFKPYFQSNYKVYHGMADIYVYFIEKAVSLLKEGGQFSYIVANKWMRANYGEPIKKENPGHFPIKAREYKVPLLYILQRYYATKKR